MVRLISANTKLYDASLLVGIVIFVFTTPFVFCSERYSLHASLFTLDSDRFSLFDLRAAVSISSCTVFFCSSSQLPFLPYGFFGFLFKFLSEPSIEHLMPYERFVVIQRDIIPSVCMTLICSCLLYTSPSPRDLSTSRMPSSA